MKKLILVLSTIFLTIFVLPQASAGNADNPEIQYLISTIETSGCTFHRNGSEHQSDDAADHLRLKLRRGKKYADTTEHFIERLASKSSWSGKPYHIECVTGEKVPMQQWMTQKLQEYRANSSAE